MTLIAMVMPSGLPIPVWPRLMEDASLKSVANSFRSQTTPSPMYLAASWRASLAILEIFPATQSARPGFSGYSFSHFSWQTLKTPPSFTHLVRAAFSFG